MSINKIGMHNTYRTISKWMEKLYHLILLPLSSTYLLLLYFSSAHGHRYYSTTTFPAHVGSVVTAKCLPSTSLVFRMKLLPDVTWDMLRKEVLPYYVGRGKSSSATCRSCNYQFTKEELRIRFEVSRKLSSGCVMPACEANVCMKLSCIQQPYRVFRVKPLVYRWNALMFC